jgi:uncharacterized membrane protein
MFPIHLMLSAVGLLLIVLAIPMILRRVPPNAIYGLRVPATYADEWVWYEANVRSGRDLVVLGILLSVLALVLPQLPVSLETAVVGWCLAAAVGAIVLAMVGWRRANRLLRERRASTAR